MIRPVIDNASIEKLRSLFNRVQRVVITCHKSPDGDALGSTLAMCHVLHMLGKEATVVTPDIPPRALAFVPGVKSIVVHSKQPVRVSSLLASAQLLMCLDYNAFSRVDKLGEELAPLRVPRVLIDHHLDPKEDFDVMISHPEASSTCELVFRVLLQLDMLQFVDRFVASCLYVGMTTDTGGYAYSCENAEFFEILMLLMRRHIDRLTLYNLAQNTFSESAVRLQGYALSQKMQLFQPQGVALIMLTREELERFGYCKGDTETLVNKPLAIPEVSWSVLLREDPDKIKVSCRSQGDFSVSDVCANYFNGGGHKNAAGGELEGTMAEAEATFLRMLADLFPDAPVVPGPIPCEDNPLKDIQNEEI